MTEAPGPVVGAWAATAQRILAWVAAGAFTAANIGHFVVGRHHGAEVLALLSALTGLLILARGSHRPLRTVVAVAALAGVVDAIASGPERTLQLGLVAVAVYRWARQTTLPNAVAAAAVAWLLMAAGALGPVHSLGALSSSLFVLTASTAIGLYSHSRTALLDAYRQRAEQAEREQQLMADRAVGAERVRIARDLHDIVAHHVSLLVVQAGAVRETLAADHRSREVLTSMVDGGRQAMTELRDMLGALRAADEIGPHTDGVGKGSPGGGSGPARTPQPDLADLPALVAGARAAGIDVELRRGPAPAIPPSVGLAAYRIIQEALTNVIKHAPGSETVVEVVTTGGGIDLRVRNHTASHLAMTPTDDGGHGLLGMQERASLCHGWVHAAPAIDGFEVHAFLPVPAADADAKRSALR